MVEIFLVAVIARHALERLHLAVDVVALEHSALLDASVELGAIGGVAAAAGALIGLIGLLLLACFIIELSQQEIKAHLLPSAGAFHSLLQVGHCLGIHLALDVIVGKGEIGELVEPLILDALGVDVHQHVVGLGGPVHGAIAQRFPYLRLQHQLGFPLEVACNVVEGCRRAQEVALHVLRLGHEIPGVVDKRVILLALEPFLLLGTVALALGLALDGV